MEVLRTRLTSLRLISLCVGITLIIIQYRPNTYYTITRNFSNVKQGVDYESMEKSTEFKGYVKHTAELQRVKLDGMSREETLAFFINVYNALVIHANVVRGPPVNLWQRYKVLNGIVFFLPLSQKNFGSRTFKLAKQAPFKIK